MLGSRFVECAAVCTTSGIWDRPAVRRLLIGTDVASGR